MNRSSFLASASFATLAAPALRATAAVPGGSHFVERRADFDLEAFQSAVDRPGTTIRQLWEAVAFHPQILGNVKNSFNGLQFGFGHPPESIAMALAAHGPSGAYNYTDEVWAKYRLGDAFKLKDQKGQPVTSNVYLKPAKALVQDGDPDNPDGIYQDTSIQTLQGRGLVMLTCHTAVEEHARMLVQSGFAPSGTSASQVADDLLTHLIPGTQVVPAMVAAIAVLQSLHRYSYITIAFA